MASLFDAINAAAAALSANAETTESRVKPRVQPKTRVQPKGSRPTPNPSRDGGEQAGAKSEPVRPKVMPSVAASPKAASKPAKPTAKAAPKTDTAKVKGGASYVIPAEFKQAIETYLNSRPDMKGKLSAKGKTIDGCFDYIFDVMRKRAEKNRGGKSAVGMYVDPQEVFGLAVHYYDESEEALKAELKS